MNSYTPADFMRMAIYLARQGLGSVSPNPPVGCVLVKDNLLVGKGYHARYGHAHAEVAALDSAGENARGATAYVTLMPCNHQGKTPPCTEALIKAGVAKVIAAVDDPNPISGNGRQRLEEAGITVETGLLAEEASWIMHGFLKCIECGLPHLILKYAMTLDGKIATANGDSQWISCTESRQRVQQMRMECDAILIGSTTAIHDNPRLNVREQERAAQPVRVVADSLLQITPQSKLLTCEGGPVVLLTTNRAPEDRRADLARAGAELIECTGADGRVDLKAGLKELAIRHGVRNVLCEGGGHLAGSLMDAGLVDEIAAFVCPKVLGGSGVSPVEGSQPPLMAMAKGLSRVSCERLGHDFLMRGRIEG